MKDTNIKITISIFFILFLSLIISRDIAMTAPIPVEIKKVVVFVFADSSHAKPAPLGTAFFIGVKNPNKENSYAIYLVTAKHIIIDHRTKTLRDRILIRLNTKDGKTKTVPIPLDTEGNKRTVFFHEDATVDLVVIPCLPDSSVYDFLYLPDEMITTKEAYHKLEIREGCDVFFTGLFTPFIGVQKNYPIFRFGRLALVTDEKIEWSKDVFCDLYLVEVGSYGGNSGSPVFFFLGSDRKPSAIVLGPPIVKLAGVMQGTYLDTRKVKIIETGEETQTIPVAQSSMGIAALVPAYKLYEILFGPELSKIRGF